MEKFEHSPVIARNATVLLLGIALFTAAAAHFTTNQSYPADISHVVKGHTSFMGFQKGTLVTTDKVKLVVDGPFLAIRGDAVTLKTDSNGVTTLCDPAIPLCARVLYKA